MSKIMIPALLIANIVFLAANAAAGADRAGEYQSYTGKGRSFIFTAKNGFRLRVTAYGDQMARVQSAFRGEDFLPDDYYGMVETHDFKGNWKITDRGEYFELVPASDGGLTVRVVKQGLSVSFCQKGVSVPLLSETAGTVRESNRLTVSFACDTNENFTGLGHDYFGRMKHLNLKGQVVERNYGRSQGQQAPLIVPFYLSGKGYGVFLNSAFPNRFNFGRNGIYDMSIETGGGRAGMDYFFILGPEFPGILDRYTQLTGRPRMPLLAYFGLAFSDKSVEHTTDASDEKWWKEKITAHRQAGFPFDHAVNDNRWRAGGGERCISRFDWDKDRYPDPAEYAAWLFTNGVITTLDFNRCISKRSDGWKPEYNLPDTNGFDFSDSAPDFTRPEVRKWFWGLFKDKGMNGGKFPCDAMWIDEFDEAGKASPDMVLGNGRTWREMKNYWFFLIAKALVADGWDKDVGAKKRPFVWVRGMTAGAQRYATLWTGDIQPNFSDMKAQVVSLQLAGLSGFPFWGHDCGGFYDWAAQKGPDETIYRQWSMAFGSFTPFWRPHGMGQSRWPLDRDEGSRQIARVYCGLRYALLPYIYTYAWLAHATGVPLARAMVLEYRNEPLAWEHDMQYFWGKDLLVAPNCSASNDVSVWLPAGGWYDFWSGGKIPGGMVTNYPAPTGKLPLFVRAGAIVPMYGPALSTAFVDRVRLTLSVYTGADGAFNLYEDDGVTEYFELKGEKRLTPVKYSDRDMVLTIGPAAGDYRGAPGRRDYTVVFSGLQAPSDVSVNGKKSVRYDRFEDAKKNGGAYWDPEKKALTVCVSGAPADKVVIIRKI